jgi:hypothetical protein
MQTEKKPFLRGSETFRSLDKERKEDVEWGARQNELNNSMLQGGKSFWPTIQLVAGKKIQVGAVPFQRRVIVQLEKYAKKTYTDFQGVQKETQEKTATVTLELAEWRKFAAHVPVLQQYIKIAESADNSTVVPDFLKKTFGEDKLYDWGKFGQDEQANIVKYRIEGTQVLMLFVWGNREPGKAANCTLALGRGFSSRDGSGKLLSGASQTIYLSGAALDYLFTQQLDVIENAARAWSDMIRHSQKLIFACKSGYDPMNLPSALRHDEVVERQPPVQDERLMLELDDE